jgi:hypothetical protein
VAALACAVACSTHSRTHAADARPFDPYPPIVCTSWKLFLLPQIGLQEQFRLITADLANGLRAEIASMEERCRTERRRPLLDRFAAIQTFLYDDTGEVTE